MAIDFATLQITVKRDDVPRATAELEKLASAGDKAEKATSRLAGASSSAGVSSVAATRNMGAWAAIQAEATGHVGEHSLALGRLERQLASVTEKFLGINPIIGLVSSSLLKFGLGTVETVGILAGIAAIGYAYDKLTENARKLREEQNKLLESLSQGNFTAKLGPAPNLVLETDAQRNELRQEQSRRRLLLKFGVSPEDDRIVQLNLQIAHSQHELEEGEKRLFKARMDATHPLDTVVTKARDYTAEMEKQQALLIRYNELMERAYGGAFDISPSPRGPRSTWRANGQTMSDDERAALNKQLGIGAIPPVSIPHVGLTDSLTKEQVRQMEVVKQLNEAYQQSIAPFKSLSAAITDFKQGLEQAATDFGQQFSPGAIGGRLLGKIAGDTSSAGGTAGGAAGLAVGSFFGPFGAAIGAAIGSRIGNVVEDLVTGGGAAKRTADRLAADSAHAMALQLDAVTKALGGDQLGGALDALKIGLISSLQAINDALPGKKNEAERNAARTLAAQQEAEQEARTQKQFAEQKQYAQEDLQVRLLKATGQGSAADLQAFKNREAREMQAALDANKDATYINTLAMVQNSELLAFLNGTLADAVRNSPSGWYGVEAYAGAYATPRNGAPSDSIGWDQTGWNGGGRTKGTAPSSGTVLHFTIENITVDGSKSANEVVNTIVDRLDRAAAATGGAGSSRSAALDVLTRR